MIRIELTQAADGRADRLRDSDAGAHRARLPGRRRNALGRSAIDINQGNLRSVNVVQAGERTRLVLNLKQAAATRPRSRASRCWSSLGAGAPAPRWSRRTRRRRISPKAATATRLPLRDIDFRRGRTARAAWSSTCRTTRSASTSASRARTWSSSSSSRRCPKPAPPPRRDRLRHAGADCVDDAAAATACAWSIEPQGRLGAQRLPDRQPVRARSAAAQGRPEQADAGRRLHRREAVAELPEHRSARGAAGDRRLHQLQHRHQRHGDRQR